MEALAGEQRGDFDSAAPGAYSSLYAGMAEATPGDTAAKMRRLQRELRNLAGKTPLPLNAAASIFLRYDSDRIDKMRAVISGESPPRSRLPAPPRLRLHRLIPPSPSDCAGCVQAPRTHRTRAACLCSTCFSRRSTPTCRRP